MGSIEKRLAALEQKLVQVPSAQEYLSAEDTPEQRRRGQETIERWYRVPGIDRKAEAKDAKEKLEGYYSCTPQAEAKEGPTPTSEVATRRCTVGPCPTRA